jgi:hypothetical protein
VTEPALSLWSETRGRFVDMLLADDRGDDRRRHYRDGDRQADQPPGHKSSSSRQVDTNGSVSS